MKNIIEGIIKENGFKLGCYDSRIEHRLTLEQASRLVFDYDMTQKIDGIIVEILKIEKEIDILTYTEQEWYEQYGEECK